MVSLATPQRFDKYVGLAATVLGSVDVECLLAVLKHQSPAQCLLCEHEELDCGSPGTHKS